MWTVFMYKRFFKNQKFLCKSNSAYGFQNFCFTVANKLGASCLAT